MGSEKAGIISAPKRNTEKNILHLIRLTGNRSVTEKSFASRGRVFLEVKIRFTNLQKTASTNFKTISE